MYLYSFMPCTEFLNRAALNNISCSLNAVYAVYALTSVFFDGLQYTSIFRQALPVEVKSDV